MTVPQAPSGAQPGPTISDDLLGDLRAPGGSAGWDLVSDRVMGGVSNGMLTRDTLAGRPALRIRGTVSLDNNGGFLQMARDVAPSGEVLDASRRDGICLTVLGNGQDYNLHLRTTDLSRPWQSYRASFLAPPRWTTHVLRWDSFAAHRTDAPLDPARLRRIGLVAIGRAFEADLAVAELRLIDLPD
jgi:hypothetical protein